MAEILAEKFEELAESTKEAKNILLVIHPAPDADALGSVFAFENFIAGQSPQKDIDIFCVDKPKGNLGALFPIEKISDQYEIEKYDTLIFLDRGDVFYKLGFDKEIERLPSPPKIVNLDHHQHTFIAGALNVIDTTASATCEIIYRLFEYFEKEINPAVAQYLLNGIYGDTGGFKHNNTTAITLEICADLMKKGASLSKPNRELFSKKSLNTLKLWAVAMDRARINPKTGMVVSFITKEDLERCKAGTEDISRISEILNTIADSNFSLVLSEQKKNRIKASLRSEEYKGVDVSKIARRFKGGGHKLSSGFEIKGNLKQVGDSWIIE